MADTAPCAVSGGGSAVVDPRWWIRDAGEVSQSDPQPEPAAQRLVRLIGVYDAESTLRGELAYWVGARLGRRHCSLCVITHGSLRQRPAWKACQVGLPVPFDTYHRNDQPDSVRAAAAGGAPVVVAETDRGVELLLTPDDLDACAGSIDRLVAALEQAVLGLGLAWPGP